MRHAKNVNTDTVRKFRRYFHVPRENVLFQNLMYARRMEVQTNILEIKLRTYVRMPSQNEENRRKPAKNVCLFEKQY